MAVRDVHNKSLFKLESQELCSALEVTERSQLSIQRPKVVVFETKHDDDS